MHHGHIAAVQGEAAGPYPNQTHNMIHNIAFSTVRRLILLLAVCLSLHATVFADNGLGSIMSLEHPNAKAVLALQKNVTHDMMNLDSGVLGTAVGLNDAGTASL